MLTESLDRCTGTHRLCATGAHDHKHGIFTEEIPSGGLVEWPEAVWPCSCLKRRPSRTRRIFGSPPHVAGLVKQEAEAAPSLQHQFGDTACHTVWGGECVHHCRRCYHSWHCIRQCFRFGKGARDRGRSRGWRFGLRRHSCLLRERVFFCLHDLFCFPTCPFEAFPFSERISPCWLPRRAFPFGFPRGFRNCSPCFPFPPPVPGPLYPGCFFPFPLLLLFESFLHGACRLFQKQPSSSYVQKHSSSSATSLSSPVSSHSTQYPDHPSISPGSNPAKCGLVRH